LPLPGAPMIKNKFFIFSLFIAFVF